MKPALMALDWLAARGMGAHWWRGMTAPLAVIAILGMMVLPMPAWMLDTFFTLNIAVALMVMMVAACMLKPLDFSAFPTVLLLTTLMRLSLNVASTRVVLLDGHRGPSAAGAVIESFGHFLIGGNFVVGLIVFAILVVINFIVVTKGSERIAEVSARFALDAMPGKQMAIDADLGAGMIDEKEARRRRAEVAEEADFFGSMDGASKFVRGDAIAGILILMINLLGGFLIGVFQHGLSAAEAASSYILLAVGDALVAQVPGLLISVAAAMVVSRVGKDSDLGGQIATQVFHSPKVLGITASVIGILGLVPGMPHAVFLLFAAGLGALAWHTDKSSAATGSTDTVQSPPTSHEASWDDLQPVDSLGLELGYRLITLVDASRSTDLLTRIKGIRKKFAQEIGFLPPPVHVRDNLELRPGQYRITLRDVLIGEGEAYPGMYLAINPGGLNTPLIGTATQDPAFGLPAKWIDRKFREHAQSAGYTVVDCETVLATHLSHQMQLHASKLLTRSETQQLLEHLGRTSPKLIDEVIPKQVSLPVFQKVLQLLLQESVHIRDMRTIIDVLAEHGSSGASAEELAQQARIALAPAIVQHIFGPVQELPVMALDPALERLVVQAVSTPSGSVLEPGIADMLTQRAAQLSTQQEEAGTPACLLVPDLIRSTMVRLLRRAAPRLQILGHSEIPDTHTIRIGPILGGTPA